MKENSYSLIIPTFNDHKYLHKLLDSLLDQITKPNEIIIVDSSSDNKIENLIKNFKSTTLNLSYYKIPPSYAGKSINYGVNLSKSEYISFLDTKTIPENNWLSFYDSEIKKKGYNLIFGSTRYHSSTYFQELLRAASYGIISHETVPGTIVKRSLFLSEKGFMEKVRSGYDIEWRNRIKKKSNWIVPQNYFINYSYLPKNILENIKKYSFYSLNSAIINIQNSIKDLYLTLLLILTALIIPRWNFMLSGWEANPLYIPNITKIYMISLIILLLIYILLKNLNFFKNTFFFSKILKFLIFILCTYSIYNWNDIVAGWVEDSLLYIPHITKIYISLIILLSILYRGIFMPLKRKVDINFLFPFKWINVGLLGLFIDITKAPFYVMGSLISPFLKKYE